MRRRRGLERKHVDDRLGSASGDDGERDLDRGAEVVVVARKPPMNGWRAAEPAANPVTAAFPNQSRLLGMAYLAPLVEGLVAEPRFAAKTSTARVRVGVDDGLDALVFPLLLERLRATAPRMKLIVMSVNCHDVEDMLLGAKVETSARRSSRSRSTEARSTSSCRAPRTATRRSSSCALSSAPSSASIRTTRRRPTRAPAERGAEDTSRGG